MKEDQVTQAYYLLGQWQEIYEQSAGKGRVGNAIGGLIFQWSDGWWKYMQESRLDIHDTNASWPNGGYPEDFREGDNNMNEEWWGITAKGIPIHADSTTSTRARPTTPCATPSGWIPTRPRHRPRRHPGPLRPHPAHGRACSRPAATRPTCRPTS